MEDALFLQQLRDLSLEDGRAYIQAHTAELTDHAAFGVLMSEDILDQLYTNPSFSLKLSELLIFLVNTFTIPRPTLLVSRLREMH